MASLTTNHGFASAPLTGACKIGLVRRASAYHMTRFDQ